MQGSSIRFSAFSMLLLFSSRSLFLLFAPSYWMSLSLFYLLARTHYEKSIILLSTHRPHSTEHNQHCAHVVLSFGPNVDVARTHTKERFYWQCRKVDVVRSSTSTFGADATSTFRSHGKGRGGRSQASLWFGAIHMTPFFTDENDQS